MAACRARRSTVPSGLQDDLADEGALLGIAQRLARASTTGRPLTAQELQIAQLAGDGLTNREIGRRLYLSHRTIATHLYRVFPKLGITARTEPAAALAAHSTPGS